MVTITQADRDLLELIYGNTFRFKPVMERLALDRIAHHREQAAADERARIVAWLRDQDGYGYDDMRAELIEAGEHLVDRPATSTPVDDCETQNMRGKQ